MDIPGKRLHSVILDEEKCKGCTICVTTCPTEAIRVRDGKARINEDRCIDCGECIRRCPHHAKKTMADDILSSRNPSGPAAYDYKIALPAPSLYGQFSARYSIGDIHAALLTLGEGSGFDEVFPVASASPFIAQAARTLLEKKDGEALVRPLISSSCPTIIKFIQIRYPTLLSHIIPVIAPMELAGRMARERALEKIAFSSMQKKPRIGVFFISPCAGKITEAAAPLGNEKSSIDGVFSMKDIHLLLHASLLKLENRFRDSGTAADEIAWGRAGGEAEATIAGSEFSYLAVDGMDQCNKILAAVEDGKCTDIDFLELMACSGGCVGGPLTVENPSLARHTLRAREKVLSGPARTQRETRYKPISNENDEKVCKNCLRREEFPARPALLLDTDYQKALQMMDSMEQIAAGLPGLDCGCCGAPNCHALAEDIVRGNAQRSDCVIILKEQYRELLENGAET